MYLLLFKDARGVLITCILCRISLPLTVFYSDGFHCEVDWSVELCPRQPCWHIRRPSCAPAGIDWTSDSTICEAIFSPRPACVHLTFLAVSTALVVSQLSSADPATTTSQQVFVVECSPSRVQSSGYSFSEFLQDSTLSIDSLILALDLPVRSAMGHVAH